MEVCMKPVLIDRSLVNMKFNDSFDFTDKKAAFMYVCALIEAGAGYVEADFQSVMHLPKPSGAENYIFRISAPEEYVAANALEFAYTVVPLHFACIIPRINKPVILEIDVGQSGAYDGGIFEILQAVSTNPELSHIGMLRLTGDFTPEAIVSILGAYRRRTVIPVDICPRNTNLSALDSAIAAYRCRSDAVTVCFADHNEFASLEEVLIMLSAMHKIVVCPDYLEGICKAALFASMFSLEKKTNLTMMMSKYMHCPVNIENIDSPAHYAKYYGNNAPRIRINADDESGYRSPAARVLSTMELDSNISAQILKIIEASSMEIYKEEKK
jgi:hypothetical protein